MQLNETPKAKLTPAQLSLIHFARRDLDAARAADLAGLSGSALILTTERLRGRLHDLLTLIQETHDVPP